MGFEIRGNQVVVQVEDISWCNEMVCVRDMVGEVG